MDEYLDPKTLARARYIRCSAGVCYWEDATVNGVEDTTGTLIPFRSGDRWCPTIDLITGKVLNWPEGMTADIHYKVCDEGDYWLLGFAGETVARREDDYVPDEFLCHGDKGHGDYIIFKVGADGAIANYKRPTKARGWTPA